MMNRFKFGAVIALFFCLNMAQASDRTLVLSEKNINDYLMQHNQYAKHIDTGEMLKADFDFSNLKINIGRQDAAKITLSADAELKAKSPLFTGKSHMTVNLDARPVFNAKTGELFLKEMKMSRYTVDSDTLRPVMSILAPMLNEAVSHYFNSNPAYVLDPTRNEMEASAKRYAKGIEITPGNIAIILDDKISEQQLKLIPEKLASSQQ